MAENKKYGRAWARQYHTYLSVRVTLLTINSCRIPSRINLQPNFTRGTYYHDYMCVLSSSVDPVPVVIHHPIRETPGTNYVVTDCETEEDQIQNKNRKFKMVKQVECQRTGYENTKTRE